jgi:hypothetical protein
LKIEPRLHIFLPQISTAESGRLQSTPRNRPFATYSSHTVLAAEQQEQKNQHLPNKKTGIEKPKSNSLIFHSLHT